MKKDSLNKILKFLLRFFLSLVFAISFLIFIFFIVLYLMRSSVPKNPQVINKDICLHFEPNWGSNEDYYIFSYYCKQSINWESVMNPPSEVTSFNEQGVIDFIDTMECPIISVSNNIIRVKQNRICDALAHDYPEPEFQQFEIKNDGKLIEQCYITVLKELKVKITNFLNESVCIDYCSGHNGDACFVAYKNACNCGNYKWDGSSKSTTKR